MSTPPTTPTAMFKPIGDFTTPSPATVKTPLMELDRTAKKASDSAERILATITFCNKNSQHTIIEYHTARTSQGSLETSPRCHGTKTPYGSMCIVINGKKRRIASGYNGTFQVVQNTNTQAVFYRRKPGSSPAPGCCSGSTRYAFSSYAL